MNNIDPVAYLEALTKLHENRLRDLQNQLTEVNKLQQDITELKKLILHNQQFKNKDS